VSLVYGPVPSWRLGRSLGVDPVSTPSKTCSFDCIYCQLGRTRHPLKERQVFVQPSQLRQQITEIRDTPIDYVTFSGVAEPTLAANLGELVAVVRKRFVQPVAILTNSSLMKRGDVRQDLALFDVVVAKVDAPNERLYQQINRPFVDYNLAEVLFNTPLRPSPVSPLSPAEMDEIQAAFVGLPVLNVYKAARPEVVFFDEEETRRRRPRQEVERR
jgi:wyosine [tRNA(Phe)-imidazoG37] synthetase (radical SAM superfamily)